MKTKPDILKYEIISYSNKEGEYLFNNLKKILSDNNKMDYFDCISYCLNELIANAYKANFKRAYFNLLNLDLNNSNDYKSGMADFFKEFIYQNQKYKDLLLKSNLKIYVTLKINNDKFCIKVINNVTVNDEEKLKISNRIKKLKKYDIFEDAFQEIYDTTEGAGIGIFTIMKLLKGLGLDKNKFRITFTLKEIAAKLNFDLSEPIKA